MKGHERMTTGTAWPFFMITSGILIVGNVIAVVVIWEPRDWQYFVAAYAPVAAFALWFAFQAGFYFNNAVRSKGKSESLGLVAGPAPTQAR